MTGDHRERTDTDLRRALADPFERHGLVALYAFGSRGEEVAARVTGEGRAEPDRASDADIGVLPAAGKELGVSTLIEVAQELEYLLSVPRVDLVDLGRADPFLAANVVRGQRLYAEDSYAADEHELYVLRRAGDLAPLERQRIALILREEP